MTGMRPRSRLKGRCWCDLESVWLSSQQVRDGETVSCGAEGCKPGSPLRKKQVGGWKRRIQT